MPLQIPYTCCIHCTCPRIPRGRFLYLDVPRSQASPVVGTQSCLAFWGRQLVGRAAAAQPGPGQSRSPATAAECWLERAHRGARRLGALPSSSRGLYSSVCFINKSDRIRPVSSGRAVSVCGTASVPEVTPRMHLKALCLGRRSRVLRAAPRWGMMENYPRWERGHSQASPPILPSCTHGKQSVVSHLLGTRRPITGAKFGAGGGGGRGCPAPAKSRGHRGCSRGSSWGQS